MDISAFIWITSTWVGTSPSLEVPGSAWCFWYEWLLRSEAPLEPPLELISFTIALLVVVAFIYNIEYIDSSAFLSQNKKLPFLLQCVV